VAAVDKLEVNNPEKLAFLTQTTLSLYDTQESWLGCGRSFPRSWALKATTSATPRRIARKPSSRSRRRGPDLVVGSQNSSNSNRLVEVAQRRGVKSRTDRFRFGHQSGLVGRRAQRRFDAGASAPEVLVEQVSQRLAEHGYTDQRIWT